MDRLTSMSVFARVLELRSFSGAARELGISQATVSKHVQTLEEWLGHQLLNRTTRRVEPTREGAGFYTRCQRIMEEIDDVRAEPGEAPLHGRVRLGCAQGVVCAILGIALGRVSATHPRLHVDTVTMDTDSPFLPDGLDATVGIEMPPIPGLVAHKLASLPLMLCASPAYIAARGMPTHPSQLAQHDCLTDTGNDSAIWRFHGAENGAGEPIAVTVRTRLTGQCPSLLRDAALGGAGILLSPPHGVEAEIAAGKLVPVMPGYKPEPAHLHAFFAPDRYLSSRLRGVLEALSQALTTS